MADVNLQRLVVSLEAKVDRYERALAKARQTTNRSFSAMEARATKFSGALAAIGAGFSLKAAQSLIDANTRITNSLKVAGLEGANLAKVYDALFASAQRNAAPLEALVELYGRASLVQKELGLTTEELLGFTDKVAVALRVSGKSAAESSGALLQLSQALGSGTVRAEEFNSILEGALPIAQAAAAGLEEAGGSVAKLRSLVVEGRISSEAFFRAFEAGSSILEDKLSDSALTVSQGFERLSNATIRAAGEFDSATGLSGALGVGLDQLAGFVDRVGEAFRNNKGSIEDFFAEVRTQAAKTEQFLKGKRQSNGETTFFEPLDINGLADYVTSLFGGSTSGARNYALDQTPGSLPFPIVDMTPGSLPAPRGGTVPTPVTVVNKPAGDAAKTFREADYASLANLPKASAPVKPVSLSDYPVDGARNGATTAIEKQRQAVLDLIDSLEFEKSLIGQSSLEQEIANAVRQAGGEATDAQREAIRTLLTEMDAERKAIEANRAAMQEFADLSRAALGGFVDDLLAGKSATEAVGGALSKIGQSFLNKGIDLLVGSIFPGFAGGGLVRGPGTGTSDSIPAMLSRGEYVLPAAAVKRIGVGNLEKMRGYARGGLVGGTPLAPFPAGDHTANDNSATTINFAPVINAGSGTSRRDLDAAMKQAKREFRDELPQMLADARKRGKM